VGGGEERGRSTGEDVDGHVRGKGVEEVVKR